MRYTLKFLNVGDYVYLRLYKGYKIPGVTKKIG